MMFLFLDHLMKINTLFFVFLWFLCRFFVVFDHCGFVCGVCIATSGVGVLVSVSGLHRVWLSS